MMSLENIFASIFAVCIYCFGVNMQLKKFKVSKKEKEHTWMLDCNNSALLLAHHGHCILMDILTYLVEDLYKYTGKWFCYTSKVINFYGNQYVTSHSFVISLIKYVLIVKWERARAYGHDKIKIIFAWLDLTIFPMISILLHLLVEPNFFVVFNQLARANRCLGQTNAVQNTTSMILGWKTKEEAPNLSTHNICQRLHFLAENEEDFSTYITHILRAITCWIQITFHYLLGLNVFEIVVYFLIFSFMRR